MAKSALLQKFGLVRAQQQSSDADNFVYPLTRNDLCFADHVQWFSFGFDTVLDPQLLKSSLERLLEIHDWRKLSGRLRSNDDGRVTLHAPKHFDAQKPAFAFHHEDYPMPVSAHPTASKIPWIKQTPDSIIYPDEDELAIFGRTESSPKSTKDFIKRQSPPLHILISSFSDATIVGLCWPHIIMDGVGFHELLHNWSLVLAGKEHKVARILDADRDPMWEMAEPGRRNAEEDWVLGKSLLIGISLFIFVLRFLWNTLFNSPPKRRIFMISKNALERLVDSTKLDLKKWTEEQGESQLPFISEGDILSAWLIKAVNKHKTWRASRPISLGQAVNLRAYLTEEVVKPKDSAQATGPRGIYLSNMVTGAYTFLPRRFVQEKSIWQVALAQRKTLGEQTTKNQVLKSLQHHRETFTRTGKYQPVFGTHDSDLFFITNGIKVKLHHAMDFSPAIVRGSADGDNTADEGTAGSDITSFFMGNQAAKSAFPGVIVVQGKDRFGNIWISPTLYQDSWSSLEKEIQRL